MLSSAKHFDAEHKLTGACYAYCDIDHITPAVRMCATLAHSMIKE